MNPRQHRRLVALSFLRDGPLEFERWADALVGALSTASPVAGIGSWRIVVVHDNGTSLPPSSVEAASRVTIEAGGALELVVRSASAGQGLLAAIADTDLVLRIACDMIVLPSTVERLIRAHDETGGTVAARLLTFGSSSGDDEPYCELTMPSGPSDPPAMRPEAVAIRMDHGDPWTPPEPSGSLIEETVRSLGAPEIAASLGERLTVPGEPMLSVVMRTQLRRLEAAREALLCLAAQADGRFELLLVGHDVDTVAVEELLAEQPGWLRDRSRVLVATGGTRSRPLNVGFAAARGTHIAVLDDDDLVTSRWVSEFLAAAAARPRQLLRAVVGVQHVAAERWPDGVSGHAALDDVTTPYPPVFELAGHLRVNATPFMAFAFPREVLEHLGGADETLEVCEDWDLVLRTAAMTGVVDISRLTAVYRRWTSGGDSYSLHENAIWQRDMQRVREKLDASPLVLPPGSASMLASLPELREERDELLAVYRSTSWRVTAPLRSLSRLLRRGKEEP